MFVCVCIWLNCTWISWTTILNYSLIPCCCFWQGAILNFILSLKYPELIFFCKLALKGNANWLYNASKHFILISYRNKKFKTLTPLAAPPCQQRSPTIYHAARASWTKWHQPFVTLCSSRGLHGQLSVEVCVAVREVGEGLRFVMIFIQKSNFSLS